MKLPLFPIMLRSTHNRRVAELHRRVVDALPDLVIVEHGPGWLHSFTPNEGYPPDTVEAVTKAIARLKVQMDDLKKRNNQLLVQNARYMTLDSKLAAVAKHIRKGKKK